MKQFSLEEYIAHPEKKVVTRDKRAVRIVCTDRKYIPIVALVGVSEDVVFYDGDGTTGRRTIELPSDLFFADEEPLTEFEHALGLALMEYEGKENFCLFFREKAKELLELARKQILQEQLHSETVLFTKEELLEHDNGLIEIGKAEALKTIPNDEEMKAMLQLEYDKGRADVLKEFCQPVPQWKEKADKAMMEIDLLASQLPNVEDFRKHIRTVRKLISGALKDLPRWKKQNSWEQMGTFMGVKDKEYFVVKDGYAISMSELMNFPGFKEDEK